MEGKIMINKEDISTDLLWCLDKNPNTKPDLGQNVKFFSNCMALPRPGVARDPFLGIFELIVVSRFLSLRKPMEEAVYGTAE